MITGLAEELQPLNFPNFLQHFLYRRQNPCDKHEAYDIPLDECPVYDGRMSVFNLAITICYILHPPVTSAVLMECTDISMQPHRGGMTQMSHNTTVYWLPYFPIDAEATARMGETQ